MTSLIERRKSPRVEAELPIAVEGGPAEASGKTLNISENGVYFEVPHFIEPLTKVRMELLVPNEADPEGEGVRFGFDGVVVRVEPEMAAEHGGPFRVAVFFTYVPEESMNALKEYLSKLLSK